MNVVGQAIRLVETEGAAPAVREASAGAGVVIGWGWQLGLVVALVIVAAVVMRRGLRRSGREEERAFAAMCRRMKLGQRHATLVRRLAAGIGAAPVALLISESAFERAVRVAGRVVESTAARRTAIEVRARVFAG
jgi:hypothetical protein